MNGHCLAAKYLHGPASSIYICNLTHIRQPYEEGVRCGPKMICPLSCLSCSHMFDVKI